MIETRKLGGLTVSDICLGTMTFGKDTPPDEALALMDRALDAGISFWDTAEMYPVNPAAAETYGRTEEIIGGWLASRGRRDEVRIATKASGPNGGHTRGGKGFEPGNIAEAVDESLRRLGTGDALGDAVLAYYGRGDVARVVAAMVAWRATPDDLAMWDEQRRMMLAERNQAWVAPLERIFAGEGTHFVAFGCGHLPGTDGVVALLRAKGWDVRPCLGDACA